MAGWEQTGEGQRLEYWVGYTRGVYLDSLPRAFKSLDHLAHTVLPRPVVHRPPVIPAPTAPPGAPPAPGSPAGLTVYGVPFNAENAAIASTLVSVGRELHAPLQVIQACVYAGMGESNLSPEAGNGGPLQTTCNYAAYDSGADWGGQAHAWYLGGECFSSGGGIAYARQYHTIWQIANAVEENEIWSKYHTDSYARSGFSTTMLEAEAIAITARYLRGR